MLLVDEFNTEEKLQRENHQNCPVNQTVDESQNKSTSPQLEAAQKLSQKQLFQ